MKLSKYTSRYALMGDGKGNGNEDAKAKSKNKIN